MIFSRSRNTNILTKLHQYSACRQLWNLVPSRTQLRLAAKQTKRLSRKWCEWHSKVMALSFLAGYSRKCVIYSIAAVILLLLIILMNLAYLPGRRFTIRKNINDSTSSKASIISTISTSSSTKATSRPNTIEPKVCQIIRCCK